MSRVWWVLGILGAALLVVSAVVVVRTLALPSRQMSVPAAPLLVVDANRAADNLAGAVRIRTLSTEIAPHVDSAALHDFHRYLQQQYPNTHRVLKREVVGDYSLLYTWPGSDAAKKPILLMAHQDVVPIAPGTEKNWQHPPFAGVRKDGFVWGRGAWDDKGNLIAQLEAVEMLAASGFKPARTIYLAFGHDEEVGGGEGATAIVALLKSRKVSLDFVIDEGMLVTEGILPGIDKPVALIGVAEKGYLSVQFETTATPGHSSMPPARGTSAIAMMSAALSQVESHPFPGNIGGVARDMFETLAPEMSGFDRIALSNLWLFEPIVRKKLEAAASTNAMLRTTTALTVVNAGNKDNVLPGSANATVNFRLLPGETQDGVLARVKEVIANDKVRVSAVAGGSDPSSVAPSKSESFQLIHRTVREVFPGTVVAPGLMVAATDSRHFGELCDHIYKFSPVRARLEDLARFHGNNERISEANLVEMIRFYHRLIEQAARKN